MNAYSFFILCIQFQGAHMQAKFCQISLHHIKCLGGLLCWLYYPGSVTENIATHNTNKTYQSICSRSSSSDFPAREWTLLLQDQEIHFTKNVDPVLL